ncbi:MAG: hypothetical protein IKX58_03660 [Clostridia bacterium]|nr:hypothetical protein [Clostridia bacterium]
MKNRTKTVLSVVLCAILFTVFTIPLTGCGEAKKYEAAAALAESGDWEAARAAFAALEDYEDSSDRVTVCDYEIAKEAMDEEEYEKAEEILTRLGEYEDSADLLKEARYQHAVQLYENGEYEKADEIFTDMIHYKQSYHYDLLSYIQYDPKAFIDEFYEGVNSFFKNNDYPIKMIKPEGQNSAFTNFFVIPDEDDDVDATKYWVNVYVGAAKKDGSPLNDGSINRISVTGASFSGKDKDIEDMLTSMIVTSIVITEMLTGFTNTEALNKEITDGLFAQYPSNVGQSNSVSEEYMGFSRTFMMDRIDRKNIATYYSMDIPELITK